MKRFWISWWQQADTSFELHSPWWRTGYDDDENYSVCAAVLAADAAHVLDIVKTGQDDFENVKLRFIEERPSDWSPFSSRFPRRDWMVWP